MMPAFSTTLRQRSTSVFTRVAVVSPESSAGLGDFRREADRIAARDRGTAPITDEETHD